LGGFLFYLYFVLSKNCPKGERAKNRGVLGEEIFCPRADGFSCPPPMAAGSGFRQEFLIK